MAENREISPTLAMKLDEEAFVAKFVAWANDDSQVKLAHLWASPSAIYSLHAHCIIQGATVELGCQSNDASWSFTHYVHPDELQRHVSIRKRKEYTFDIDSFMNLNFAQTGEDDQQNKIVLIDTNEDFNIQYAVGMMQLARTIGDALGSTGPARLRILWLSNDKKPDSTLSRKMSIFAPLGMKLQIDVLTFPFSTAQGSVQFLEDLTWQQTDRGDDQAFMETVARRIALDFVEYKDVEDENAEEGSADGETAVPPISAVFLWDGICRKNTAYQPQFFTAVLGKLIGQDSFETLTLQEAMSRQATAKSKVVTMGSRPRLTHLPADTKHIILCTSKRQTQFDTETSHIVVSDERASRADLKSQAELAFFNASRIRPGKVIIHCQLELDEIDAMPARHLFEEIHLASFLVMAWDIDPTLDLDQLLNHFVERIELFYEALRHLQLLGLLRLDIDNPKLTLNKALIKKVASILPAVDYNIQTAKFLSQMTSETSHALRQGLIDLAAISLRFHPATEQSPFIYFDKEMNARGALDHSTVQGQARWEIIARDCRDVPLETLMEGPMWLALGVYRMMCQWPGQGSLRLEPAVSLADGMFKAEIIQFDYIRGKSDMIYEYMVQAVPPAIKPKDLGTELQMDDIASLQKSMLRAWCGGLLHAVDINHVFDVVCRTDAVRLDRRAGFFYEGLPLGTIFVIALERLKQRIEGEEDPMYRIRLSVSIPTDIVGEFARETDLSYEDLETRFPLYRT